MDEFLVIMRLDILTKEAQPTPEQLEGYMKSYHEWVDGIIATNKFVGGTGLSTEGKVIANNDVVTDGPFVEMKESLAGFITIKAKDFSDALAIARECPTLNGPGNTVEVRKVVNRHNPE